jgi:uncharacterized protein
MGPVVDWHSHVWRAEHLGPHWGTGIDRGHEDQPDRPSVSGDYAHHQRAMREAGVDYAIVLSVRSRHIQMDVPNEYIADYVGQHDNLVGVGSVDPNSPDRVAEVARVAQLGLRGLKLSPPYQSFHPHSREAFEVYEAALAHDLFLIFHQGSVFTPTGPLEVAQPVLLDRVARELPDLRIIVAHVGQPWVQETIALVAKHRNVYADISARHNRPWQLFTALAQATDYRVTGKLLWGSDFPCFTMTESLRDVRSLPERIPLPPFVDPGLCEQLITDRPLSLLGLEPGLRLP